MRFNSHSHQPPARLSRRRQILIILLIYGCIKVLVIPHLRSLHLPHGLAPVPHPIIAATAGSLPIVAVPAMADSTAPAWQNDYFHGRRVWGNGTDSNLGDRRTHLPGSLWSKFFPDAMILPSCLTELPPATPAPSPQKPLPVREDWPGFYGAPWVARMDGNLLVLLNVYAPRHADQAVPAPQFQLYPNYTGNIASPAYAVQAPARLYRGSKAVLYRLFLSGPAGNGPVRCLDLIVQNGENNGVGHLYYQKYHHYYESDANFVIQQ